MWVSPFYVLDEQKQTAASCRSRNAVRNVPLYVRTYFCLQEILLSYNAVGIFEEWDLSMQLFDARVKSPVEQWDANIANNPGEQSPPREELTHWAHSSPEVHDLLSADIHIYLQLRDSDF